MTAPISIAYEDWKAVVDDANKAQERVNKLEAALKQIEAVIPLSIYSANEMHEIARRALEE